MKYITLRITVDPARDITFFLNGNFSLEYFPGYSDRCSLTVDGTSYLIMQPYDKIMKEIVDQIND
jgi:hypothetical protein